MMTEEEAKQTFACYLTKPCMECEAPEGELCSSIGVWVHWERMKLFQT